MSVQFLASSIAHALIAGVLTKVGVYNDDGGSEARLVDICSDSMNDSAM